MTNSNILLRIGSIERLARFTANQLNNMFPDEGLESDVQKIMSICNAALGRLEPILAAVKNFTPNEFNHLNALQYTSYLYLLANEYWLQYQEPTFSERLFCLNRALNSVDLFYSVKLPEVFFVSHGLGAVMGNATYGNSLVIFQNTTVGRVGDDRPTLGDNVILYPNSMVTGNAVIGHNCVISAGAIVHGVSVPDNTLVFVKNNELVFKSHARNYTKLYFR